MNSSKSLDTLVEDIYSVLSPLCENKPIDISDESIEELGDNLKNIFYSWKNPEKRNSNFSLRMSNVGKPSRQLWYESRDGGSKESISPPTFIKFLYGHLLEEILLFLVNLSGHTVTDQQKEVNVDGILGHIDSKIDGEVVDVKTASGRAFNKFLSGTLAEDDPFGYIAQLSGYEESEGTSNGGFLAINKETGELALYKPEELDKVNIKNRINKIKSDLALDSPPERCYDPVPEGKGGNMKLNKNCNYCPYKFECYSDSNDGKGLRQFQYARGPVFLTEVKSVPRVEEIT